MALKTKNKNSKAGNIENKDRILISVSSCSFTPNATAQNLTHRILTPLANYKIVYGHRYFFDYLLRLFIKSKTTTWTFRVFGKIQMSFSSRTCIRSGLLFQGGFFRYLKFKVSHCECEARSRRKSGTAVPILLSRSVFVRG